MVTYIVVYSILIFVAAASVVACSVLSARRARAQAKSRAERDKVRAAGERLFIDLVGGGDGIAYLIFHKQSQQFAYVSPNIGKFVEVTPDEMYADMSCLNRALGKKLTRELSHGFHEWDGSGVFSMEFDAEDGKTTLFRAAIVKRDGDEYRLYMLSDATEAAEARKKKQAELDEALRLASEKSSFLSNMSHEIRTPMNGIMGMMSLAKMNIDDSEKVSVCLEKAGYLAGFLIGMINDILDISKIESGRMQLYNNPFDLFNFADKLNNMFAGTMQNKGINYKVETVDFSARVLVGDELRLTQVVTNLISNAQKFTPSGGSVTVTFKQLGMLEGRMQLMIRVRDTGKGIAPESIRKIMKPFEQEDASTSHNYGGTGLGLAITDNFVKLMGGNIVIDSEPGKGSDFSVYLSLPVAAEQSELSGPVDGTLPEGDDDFSYEGLRILMAEDNEINAEIATEILESEGAEVTLARDGQECVDIFTAAEPGRFDLLLVDIQMPKMDGREATRHIRAGGKPDAKDVVIIALSADAFVEDVVKSKEAGMDGHVSKPIDFDELKNTVAALFKEKKSGKK